MPLAFGAVGQDVSAADTAAGFTYAWDFNDGTNSTLQFPLKTYTVPGTYDVELVLQDKDGGTRTCTTPILSTDTRRVQIV